MTEAPACRLHISNSPPHTDTASRSRRGFARGLPEFRAPLITEGAGNAGCALHRPSRVQNCKKRTRAYRFSGGNPAFPAQWFYGVLRALPGDQACLTPSPALLIADLTPASGRQNDTTWPYASGRSRLARCRVHRIPTRVRDVRETPLCGSDRRISELIWVRWQAKVSEFQKISREAFSWSFPATSQDFGPIGRS